MNRLEPIPADTEPGMNFISADFDLVMVNRTNERLYGKPMVALLGKKCYHEFEKRDKPCPHCPGKLALATGEAHETETVGMRDDGTRYAVRIRAHPVAGPDNQPTGFIEVVDDITEQKRAESLSIISADLRAVLPVTQSVSKALRETLDAALRVEGIDSGCAFLVDQATGEHTLVCERNVRPDCLETFAAVSKGEPTTRLAGIEGAPQALEVITILHRGDVTATMLVGASTYPAIPPTLRAGLQSLGTAAGNAISRIRAEQSRGDAVADLEALIAVTPVPTWVIDTDDRVTMWNRAAERLFGWRKAEVVGHSSPLARDYDGQDVTPPPPNGIVTSVLARKDGSPVEVRLVTAPFRDLVGNASTVILMAEDMTLEKRLAEMQGRPAGSGVTTGRGLAEPTGDAAGSAAPPERVLIVDSAEPWGQELAGILSGLGYSPTRCVSMSEAAVALADAEAKTRPFDLAVVDLFTSTGSSGLGQSAVLRGLGLMAPVVVSSDADVRGHEQHGIAGVIRRPYEAEAVERAVRGALKHRG